MDMITYARLKKLLAAGGNTELLESIITEEVTKVVGGADAKFDTLKEIADWIKSDTTGAAKMQTDISELKNDLTNIELTPGPQGPQGDIGPQGPKGDPSKSAYEYAQDGGYIGTEEEFADDLHNAMNPAQVDWEQNDETALSFVKNRTHYTETIKNIKRTFIENRIFTTTEDFESGVNYSTSIGFVSNEASGFLYDDSPASLNKTYTVKFNDVYYVVKPTTGNASPMIKLGNPSISHFYAEDNGLPFLIYVGGYGVVRLATKEAETFSISVYEGEIVEKVIKLDEKFIPETIARVTEMLTSYNDLKDKPFYEDGDTLVKIDEKFIPVAETAEIVNMLAKEDMLIAITDANDSILIDNNNNILTL